MTLRTHDAMAGSLKALKDHPEIARALLGNRARTLRKLMRALRHDSCCDSCASGASCTGSEPHTASLATLPDEMASSTPLHLREPHSGAPVSALFASAAVSGFEGGLAVDQGNVRSPQLVENPPGTPSSPLHRSEMPPEKSFRPFMLQPLIPGPVHVEGLGVLLGAQKQVFRNFAQCKASQDTTIFSFDPPIPGALSVECCTGETDLLDPVTCRLNCIPGNTLCPRQHPWDLPLGKCVDTTSDDENCGICGKVCYAPLQGKCMTCAGGGCVPLSVFPFSVAGDPCGANPNRNQCSVGCRALLGLLCGRVGQSPQQATCCIVDYGGLPPTIIFGPLYTECKNNDDCCGPNSCCTRHVLGGDTAHCRPRVTLGDNCAKDDMCADDDSLICCAGGHEVALNEPGTARTPNDQPCMSGSECCSGECHVPYKLMCNGIKWSTYVNGEIHGLTCQGPCSPYGVKKQNTPACCPWLHEVVDKTGTHWCVCQGGLFKDQIPSDGRGMIIIIKETPR